jgi:flavin-dependent thymidylate synthase
MRCELTGHFGGDTTHALSAWTSTHRELDPARILRIPDLLALLAAGSDGNEHGTPFEKSYIQFLIRVDTVTHYQILKHRIGVSANTESARYKTLSDATGHVPGDWPQTWQERLAGHHSNSVRLYKQALNELEPLLGKKRAKESARFFLPLSNELTMDVSFNFRSFVAFQRLRNADGAQREINQLSDTMLEQVRSVGDFEHSLSAFKL